MNSCVDEYVHDGKEASWLFHEQLSMTTFIFTCVVTVMNKLHGEQNKIFLEKSKLTQFNERSCSIFLALLNKFSFHQHFSKSIRLLSECTSFSRRCRYSCGDLWSTCKKVAHTKQTARVLRHFVEEKDLGEWFNALFPLLKGQPWRATTGTRRTGNTTSQHDIKGNQSSTHYSLKFFCSTKRLMPLVAIGISS